MDAEFTKIIRECYEADREEREKRTRQLQEEMELREKRVESVIQLIETVILRERKIPTKISIEMTKEEYQACLFGINHSPDYKANITRLLKDRYETIEIRYRSDNSAPEPAPRGFIDWLLGRPKYGPYIFRLTFEVTPKQDQVTPGQSRG